MSKTSIKQQMVNYSSLFKQLFTDYYKIQKKNFWLIQLLIILSTVTGIFWILTIFMGISNLQNPETNQQGIKFLLFAWIYKYPLWQWLIIASIAGVVSAFSLYHSFKLGVKSVLEFQKHLNKRCLSTASHNDFKHWPLLFEQQPHQILIQILKQGVQLCGLVARRMTRATVSVITFIVAFIVLTYLDSKLLIILLPFSILYIIALYFINRYASRVSMEMNENIPKHNSLFNTLVRQILNNEQKVHDPGFDKQFHDSLYLKQAELRYNRRLAEIHVTWLNSLFLVLGIALIIIYMIYILKLTQIDWQNLFLFLITLKYAASSLQQLASTTVAFSRFLPEIDLVYRLLNIDESAEPIIKHKISTHTILFCNSNHFNSFERNQMMSHCEFHQKVEFFSLQDIRTIGLKNFFKSMQSNKNNQIVIIENRLKQLQQFINLNIDTLKSLFPTVNVLNLHENEIQMVEIMQFDQFKVSENEYENTDLLDV